MSTLVNPAPAAAGNIFDKAVCVVVNTRTPGSSRKVKESEATVKASQGEDPDKKVVGATKKLFDSEEFRAIKQLDADCSKYLRNRCVPSVMKMSTFLVPIALIEEVDTQLTAYRNRREELIAAFIDVYETRIEEAKVMLGGLHNPLDYHSRDDMKSRFAMSWQYVEFSTPGKLSAVSASFFEREKQRAAAEWSNATEQMRMLLRQTMQELVSHMAERLEPNPDGSKKKIFSTTADNLIEFLGSFSIRNITDDRELEALTAQAQALLGGVSLKDLKTNDVMRANVSAGISRIKAQLDTLVDTRTRAVEFSDE